MGLRCDESIGLNQVGAKPAELHVGAYDFVMTAPPEVASALRSLSLEITSRCQLTCPSLCYAQAGPSRAHGTMTAPDWLHLIDEAAALGVESAQVIGGEPSLHPAFADIVEHALAVGLRVRVYTNLVLVRAAHWRLYEHPRVSLATSYHSDVPGEHDAITGRRGSHAATRGNIGEAVRRGCHVTVGVIDMGGGQRTEHAVADMLALGVDAAGIDHVRAVGNAATSAVPPTAALCGRCGDERAAVLPDGSLAVCEIGRALTAGNVRDNGLAALLASNRWAEAIASVPRRRAGAPPCLPDCKPNDDTCKPPQD